MKLTYRSEIDGLRAIAVGAVILYHARITILGYQPFKGGFIGVDIFFVISGYLITSIILKELVTTGSFSFKHFYERRIRRILPVLLFVILVSLPFAWIYLTPSSFIDFSKSILYSFGFSSNFYFHYSGQHYGAESGLLKPFLHTWSLSVEEQFYILFPIVLMITFKYFRKYVIHILILGFVISLGLADWGSRNHPSFNFYVLPTRGWELLAGSILAYFEINNAHRSKNKILNLIMPSIGLLLIGHSVLFFNNRMFHPSFYTLPPIIGVCLIIWFSNKDEIITKILSTKLFVGIGLISYSLYLWHYPIFAFARVNYLFDKNIFNKSIFILITLTLSIISYYFIEKVFRDKKYQFKKLLSILLIFVSFLIFFNYFTISNDGIKKRFPKIFHTKLKEDNIVFFQKEDAKKVVLIGDSHANSLALNLNEEIKKQNLSLLKFSTKIYIEDNNESNNRIDNFLEEHSNLIVIVHSYWGNRFGGGGYDNFETFNIKKLPRLQRLKIIETQRYIKDRFKSQINKIINLGHKVILVYPVPDMKFNPIQLMSYKYNFEKNLFKNSIPILSRSYEIYKNKNRLAFEILDSFQNPNIYRVYPHQLFCNQKLEDRCVANDENNFFYYDNNHLSIQGSKFVVDEIMKEIEKIELKSN